MNKGYGRLSCSGSYSITYNLPYWFYKFINNKKYHMGDITVIAEKRLAMIEFYYQVKDATAVCNSFKTSRKTFYKWLNRYEKSGKKLFSLEDEPKTPKTKRKTILHFRTELKIKHLRERYIRLGKVKLQKLFKTEHNQYIPLSDEIATIRFIFQRHNPSYVNPPWRVCNFNYEGYISQSHIAYVIKKYNLYFNPIKAKRIKSKKDKLRGAKKIRINEVNPKDYLTEEKPFFFCLDSIVLYLPYGIKRYILTSVEYEKKIAYAKCYSSKSSLSAFDFLLRLFALVDGKISAILSDNGSEFAKYFEEACRRLKITHIYTRIKTPKDNSINERFNRTIQEEFMETDEYFEPYLTESNLIKANESLTNWLVFYNFKRPHQTLKYKTPIEWYTLRS